MHLLPCQSATRLVYLYVYLSICPSVCLSILLSSWLSTFLHSVAWCDKLTSLSHHQLPKNLVNPPKFVIKSVKNNQWLAYARVLFCVCIPAFLWQGGGRDWGLALNLTTVNHRYPWKNTVQASDFPFSTRLNYSLRCQKTPQVCYYIPTGMTPDWCLIPKGEWMSLVGF